MKKIFSFLFLSAIACASQAGSTWNVRGTQYQVDTLFHNQVAPGAMQTSLWFHTASGKTLRVFYSTMDMTNPHVHLSGVCATDKLAGNERVSAMAQRKSVPGKRYVVGMNADFFETSGGTRRGVSTVGSPIGSTVVEGTIFRARNNAKHFKNFVVDTQGKFYVNPFTFGGSVTASAGVSAPLGGINISASDSYAQNAIIIYNDRYYGSTDANAGCSEVTAVLAQGETFKTAQPFKMVVTSAPGSEGDMTIPAGGYVLHAGGSACDLVNGLKEGDVVTVSPSWSFEGKTVEPQEVISGNPKILANGITLDSEGDRGDASALHPRAGIGYSHDGSKVYFFVVDGRSTLSSGVRTSELADIMRYAGVTDAMNVDGGGSAVLYTSALGIRNKPSDGSERADGNGIFLVSTAPDDSVVAQIRFVDFSLKSPRYGVYTPKFYGYNQYGMLVNQDVKGVKLSCDEQLGHILGDTTFYADGTALQGMLTATWGDATVSMPMQVTSSVDAIAIACDSVINDTFLAYPIDVQCVVGEKVMPVNPAALTWQSTNEQVVKVGHDTGVLQGVANGTALVIGKVGDVTDTLKVIVEKPTARVMPIDAHLDVSTWKISQTGGKNAVATAHGDGIDYSYVGASARAPKIVLSKQMRLWSLPDTVRLRVNPGEAPVKNVVFSMRANGQSVKYVTVTPQSIKANQEMVIDLPTASWIDAARMANYPLVLNSMQVNMNASMVGKQYQMQFLGFETVYKAMPQAVAGDVNGDGQVNATDVTTLVNMILQVEPARLSSADLNHDGSLNVTDVTTLINLIVKK